MPLSKTFPDTQSEQQDTKVLPLTGLAHGYISPTSPLPGLHPTGSCPWSFVKNNRNPSLGFLCKNVQNLWLQYRTASSARCDNYNLRAQSFPFPHFAHIEFCNRSSGVGCMHSPLVLSILFTLWLFFSWMEVAFHNCDPGSAC